MASTLDELSALIIRQGEALQREMAGVKGAVAEVQTGQRNLDGNFAKIEGELVKIEGKFAQMEGKFAQMENSFIQVNEHIGRLQRTVNAIESLPPLYRPPKTFHGATEFHSVSSAIRKSVG